MAKVKVVTRSMLVHTLLFLVGFTSLSGSAFCTEITPVTPDVNPKLEKFQKIFTPPRLVKMGTRVHMAFGYDYANFSFIEGDDGVIVVDTGFYSNPAARALADYRKLVKKPIKAIIYTHVHYDHRGGSPVFAKEAGEPIPVYALNGWQHHALYDVSGLRPTIVRRGLCQFGILLPVGKEGTVGAGVGPVTRADGRAGFVLPTQNIDQKTELTLCGVRMVFMPTPADIQSNMMVWLPDDKVLISGDLIGGTLPYITTARFEKERNARDFINGLDKALMLEPDYVAPGHGRPLLGAKDVLDVLKVNRDACVFLDDQVTRYVNKGYSPDQIIDILKLPPPHCLPSGSPTPLSPAGLAHTGAVPETGRLGFRSCFPCQTHRQRKCQTTGGTDRRQRQSSRAGCQGV